MIQLKKQELESLLLTIATYSAPKEGEQQKLVGGLLSEDITLGTKRKLQKIHKVAVSNYTELIKDISDLKKECGDDSDKFKEEVTELLNESVKLDVECILFSAIENISTKFNYDFDIIDKFTVNPTIPPPPPRP